MASHVHNGAHNRNRHGISIDSWNRDATSSSIPAYPIPWLLLHFCFYLNFICSRLTLCSVLHDFHVLMHSSPFNWLPTVCSQECGILFFVTDAVTGEIKNNGCDEKEPKKP